MRRGRSMRAPLSTCARLMPSIAARFAPRAVLGERALHILSLCERAAVAHAHAHDEADEAQASKGRTDDEAHKERGGDRMRQPVRQGTAGELAVAATRAAAAVPVPVGLQVGADAAQPLFHS